MRRGNRNRGGWNYCSGTIPDLRKYFLGILKGPQAVLFVEPTWMETYKQSRVSMCAEYQLLNITVSISTTRDHCLASNLSKVQPYPLVAFASAELTGSDRFRSVPRRHLSGPISLVRIKLSLRLRPFSSPYLSKFVRKY